MDNIAKDVPFWGSLLPPRLSVCRIVDLIDPLLEKSDCMLCDCNSYHYSTVFIYNLKTNINNLSAASSKVFNDYQCKACQHSFDHHINPRIFNKPDRIVQEVVLKHDLDSLQIIADNESPDIRIILEDVMDDYHRLLMKRNIPAMFIDPSNDTPAEIPSIEFILNKLVKHIESSEENIDPTNISNAVKVFISYLDDHFTLPAKAHFSERDSALYKEFYKLFTINCETPRVVKSLKQHRLTAFFGVRFFKLFYRKMISCFKFYYDEHHHSIDTLGPQYYDYSQLFDYCEKLFSSSSELTLSLIVPKNLKQSPIDECTIFNNDKFYDPRFINSLGPSSSKRFPDYEYYQIESSIVDQILKKRSYDQYDDEFFEEEINVTCRLEYLDLEDCENDPKDLQTSRKYLLSFLTQLMYINHLPNMAPAVRTKIVRPNKSILLIDSDNVFAGATYRIGDGFCELLFLVVNAEYQTKGYGSVLMDLLKDICAREQVPTIYAFADNNALPFFEKQGFRPPPNEIRPPKDLFECNGATFMWFKIDKSWSLKNYQAVKLLRLDARDKMIIELRSGSSVNIGKKRKTINGEQRKNQQFVRKFWRKFKEDSAHFSVLETFSKKSCIKTQLKYIEFALEFKILDNSIEEGNYGNDVEMFAFDMRRMLEIFRPSYQKKFNKKDFEDFIDLESEYKKYFDDFFPGFVISLQRSLT